MRWFIGDLHGCREELEELLEKIFQEDRRPELFCTGDAIGKGPDPAGTLRLISSENIAAIRGNHEDQLIRMADEPVEKLLSRSKAVIKVLESDLPHYLEQISGWPLYYELEDVDLVHAGLQPGVSQLSEMDPRILLTIRTWDGEGKQLWSADDPPWFQIVQWPKKVVFGHWAYQMPTPPPGFYGLDSGCVYGGWLTAWCAEEDRILRVRAHNQWAPGKK
jgi:bis(5'-nucleosyl)-tetraphosphatase (symmetrical)